MQPIPYGRQSITQEDVNAVVEVLKSDFLTQGPVIGKFEAAIAQKSQAKYAVAVSNATAALHIACLSLGLQPGEIVWTSPISFVASANCALYCGAEVDFVDIDPVSYNISVSNLKKKLESARLSNKLPRIVIPVHLAGTSCDMKAISDLSREYGFKIIEDASHAIGGQYLENPIGSCKYSDITVFSFHPVKIITTGEGGMALTNDAELFQRMVRLRSHGITREPAEMSEPPRGDWFYEQQQLGFNYRLTDIQAALGLSQLSRLDAFLKRRHEIRNLYETMLSGLDLQLPTFDANSYSALHLYIIRLRTKNPETDRDRVFKYLRSQGILVNLHYIPIYHQPYYRQFGYNHEDFPESERYYQDAMSIPIFPLLGDDQVAQVCEKIKIALARV